MALNKYMHPRNIYRLKKPSFKKLASLYDFFKEVVIEDEEGHCTLDFKSPAHLAALSKALLIDDFSLHVEFPLDRLVPTVPLRLNYILWLEDLFKSFVCANATVTVLDIGVGASCIYPLLGAKKFGWRFMGTETDARNYAFAVENVARNSLENLVRVSQVQENQSSLETVLQSEPHLTAVMVNPPFYCDTSDAIGTMTSRSITRLPAKTVTSAARQESQTRGGEVYFCMRLAKESVKYATRVGVFTVMLGKKNSVAPLKRILHKLNIPRYSVYELCQGRIMRWGLAWTFQPNVEFPESEFRRLRKLERPPLALILPPAVSCLPDYSVTGLLDWLRIEFRQLEMTVLDQKNRADIGGIHLTIRATKNSWTHMRRKRRVAQRRNAGSPQSLDTIEISSIPATNGYCDHVTVDKDCNPSSTKRPITSSQTAMCVGGTTDEEYAISPKKARIDEACVEADAWLDDEVEPTTSVPPPTQLDYLIQADVFVNQQFSSTTSSDPSISFEDALDTQPTGPLVIKILFTGGTCREAANQIICYLKNRLQ